MLIIAGGKYFNIFMPVISHIHYTIIFIINQQRRRGYKKEEAPASRIGNAKSRGVLGRQVGWSAVRRYGARCGHLLSVAALRLVREGEAPQLEPIPQLVHHEAHVVVVDVQAREPQVVPNAILGHGGQLTDCHPVVPHAEQRDGPALEELRLNHASGVDGDDVQGLDRHRVNRTVQRFGAQVD